jgi:hypothetical protein
VVMCALRVIDKVRRSLSVLRNKPMDLYAALLLLKLTKSLDMGVFFVKSISKALVIYLELINHLRHHPTLSVFDSIAPQYS